MKFKIIELEQKGNNLHVAIEHEKCKRQVFSLPIEYYDGDRYIEEIKRILKESYLESKKRDIDKSNLNKEFEA